MVIYKPLSNGRKNKCTVIYKPLSNGRKKCIRNSAKKKDSLRWIQKGFIPLRNTDSSVDDISDSRFPQTLNVIEYHKKSLIISKNITRQLLFAVFMHNLID